MFLPFSNKMLSQRIPSNSIQVDTQDEDIQIFLLNDPTGVQDGAKICWYIAQAIPSTALPNYIVTVVINYVSTTLLNKYGVPMTVADLQEDFTYHCYYSSGGIGTTTSYVLIATNTPATTESLGCPTIYNSSSVTVDNVLQHATVNIGNPTLTSPSKVCFRILQDIPNNCPNYQAIIEINGKKCILMNKYAVRMAVGELNKNYLYKGYYVYNPLGMTGHEDQVILTNSPIESF